MWSAKTKLGIEKHGCDSLAHPLHWILDSHPSPNPVAILRCAGRARLAAFGGAGIAWQIAPPEWRVFVVTQPLIRKHWGAALRKAFSKTGRKIETVTMPDGERAKTLAQLEKLASKLVSRGADRRSIILALGGGVVGDVGAFLASVFMRGIPVVQIPTTLVAQVDSAIGGKTGVNLKSGKNLLGTFHQPMAVLADPDVLATLPEREYRSGLFEAMKYGVIRNAAIFKLMEANSDALLCRDGALVETLITECIRVKAGRSECRRTGERRASHPELWTHYWTRAGGGDRLRAVPSRGSGGVGHDCSECYRGSDGYN